MHSRIYKLQENLTAEFEPIREWDYESNGFIDVIGDWVTDDTDWMDDYEWLSDSSKSELWKVSFGDPIKIERDDEEVEVPVGYLTINLAKAKQWLLERAQKVVDLIKEDPMKVFGYGAQELILGDKFGFYFDIGDSYYTDVEFIKYCVEIYRDKEEVTFRLEGTLDYHS